MSERKKYINLVLSKLNRNPAVVLLGARQVGKTTLAKNLTSIMEKNVIYFDLESPNTLLAIKNDPENFINSYQSSLVIFDEVQEFPPIFGILRSVIDLNRQNCRFLLLGSANPKLIKGVSESLAGRVAYIELPSLLYTELQNMDILKHWYRGGMPLSIFADSDSDAFDWLQDYIRAYAERDVNLLFGLNLNTNIIKRLWTMLAHLNGTTLNNADLGRSLGVSSNTVNGYIDVLEGAYLIRKLNPWYVNVGKRLVKSPKVYLADTGLLHVLLGIKSYHNLILHPIVGASWEGYVITQILFEVEGHFDTYFYRTQAGTEMDLVLVKADKPFVSIEIKNSDNPSITKGFHIAIEDLRTEHNYIITKSTTFTSPNGLNIVSLKDFLTKELPMLIDI